MIFKITTANVDDRKSVMNLAKMLAEKLFKDKRYLMRKLCYALHALTSNYCRQKMAEAENTC